MKFSELVKAPKLIVRKETAKAMFDCEALFERMVKYGWVRPCDRVNNTTLYLVSDLEKAAQRLSREELPK